MENHGKYGALIYAHQNNDLYVNLFIPSVLNWAEKGLVVTQQTSFPFDEKTELTLKLKKSARFALHLRCPGWATGMQVWVNAKPVVIRPNSPSFLTLDRLWKNGDKLTISLPMTTTTEVLPDSSAWVSFLHGPIVLGAATDGENLTGLVADGSRMGHIASGPLYPLTQAPLLVGNRSNLISSVKSVPGKPLTFLNLFIRSVTRNCSYNPSFRFRIVAMSFTGLSLYPPGLARWKKCYVKTTS